MNSELIFIAAFLGRTDWWAWKICLHHEHTLKDTSTSMMRLWRENIQTAFWGSAQHSALIWGNSDECNVTGVPCWDTHVAYSYNTAWFSLSSLSCSRGGAENSPTEQAVCHSILNLTYVISFGYPQKVLAWWKATSHHLHITAYRHLCNWTNCSPCHFLPWKLSLSVESSAQHFFIFDAKWESSCLMPCACSIHRCTHHVHLRYMHLSKPLLLMDMGTPKVQLQVHWARGNEPFP